MKRARKTTKGDERGAAPPAPSERRRNLALREALDDLVDHVRWISRKVGALSPDEIEYAQQRLEWMADEVWRLAVEESDGERHTSP